MNEDVLILLAKDGNEAAFRSLYDRYRESVYGMAYHYTRSCEDAQDILQETFIKAFKHLNTFRNERDGAFQAWITQICVYNSINHLKSSQGRRKLNPLPISQLREPASADPLPDQETERDQIMRQIRCAMEKLSAKQRVIFDLHHIQHENVRSISQLLNTSESNIKTQLSRSRVKLKKALKSLLEEI